MKKIIITGVKGTVGKILKKHLDNKYNIVGLDLPDEDITNYPLLKQKTKNANVIIHLAMNPEDGIDNQMNPGDLLMAYNIYKVAKENNIPRVIMFSSVHANDYSNWKLGDKPLKTNLTPTPDSPYGAYKIYMEALGRYFSKRGLEVICIRLGGVNAEDDPNINEKNYRSVYLSHSDLIDLIKICIEIPSIKNNYELLYAVSNNEPLIHDFSNNLGWKPKKGTR